MKNFLRNNILVLWIVIGISFIGWFMIYPSKGIHKGKYEWKSGEISYYDGKFHSGIKTYDNQYYNTTKGRDISILVTVIGTILIFGINRKSNKK